MPLSRLFLNHTPIETYQLHGYSVDVKREDLYCREMIAPLAKMRGVHVVMQRLKNEGVNTVGVFDFKVSKAGVGISAMAKYLGMECIECYQHYKKYNTEGLPAQQLHCSDWGAELYPVPAAQININFAIGKRYVESRGGYMFPKGIILEETIDSVAGEVVNDAERIKSYSAIVINVGSGTIITGLLKGLIEIEHYPNIFGICCTNETKHCKRLYKFLDSLPSEVAGRMRLQVLPADFEYYTECPTECPFPSHPNYDRKAWHWLINNHQTLDGKTLFWNIGA